MVDTHFGLSRGSLGTFAGTDSRASEIVELTSVPVAEWSGLASRAIEPNAFYAPALALAVTRHVPSDENIQALLAWDSPAKRKLIGFLPVVSTWRAMKMPLPVLVTWHAYAPLSVPLLDRDYAVEAASKILAAAKQAGARALLFSTLTDGAASAAFHAAGANEGRQACVLRSEPRALLDARIDADHQLQESLGSKKLKELRRQRKRLAEDGELRFSVSVSPQQTEAALQVFMRLEAAGWKGQRGTALGSQTGLSRFVREAARKLAPQGKFEVATLTRGADVIAAALIVRDGERANYFKTAYDESLAKYSPGVQLTLDLTRYFCADSSISSVDSVATADHPMINAMWKGRLEIAEVLFPTGSASVSALASIFRLRGALRDSGRSLVRRFRAGAGSR